MDNHLVIMAGGIGSRFWPMSRPEKPKQFIDVLGVGRSLLQLTVDRFGGMFSAENIWVVTSDKYFGLVHEQLPELPVENILLEPCMRNTTPCIAYVVWKILLNHPDANVVVSPADHFVVDTAEFQRVVKCGLEFVDKSSRVLTLGMTPTRPETGYGYIQSSGKAVEGNICDVLAFKEKPDLETAQKYIAEGNYYWNAGIFFWTARFAQSAIRHFEPEIATIFDEIGEYFYTADEESVVAKLFPDCKNISIDYAVMEHLGGNFVKINNNDASVYVCPASFGWSDLGTWGSLYTHIEKDGDGNGIIGGNITMIESSGCIVRTSGKMEMVLQGLENMIIAEDEGTLLICKKEDEQRIKEFSQVRTKKV